VIAQVTAQLIVEAQDREALTLQRAADIIQNKAAQARSHGAHCPNFDLAVEATALLTGLSAEQRCGIIQLAMKEEN
jgi:hypothetical protein